LFKNPGQSADAGRRYTKKVKPISLRTHPDGLIIDERITSMDGTAMVSSAAVRVYDIERFTLKEMTLCGQSLRQIGTASTTLEEVASKTCEQLYEQVVTQRGERAFALVQFFHASSNTLSMLAAAGANTNEKETLEDQTVQLYNGTPSSPIVMQMLSAFGVIKEIPALPKAELLVDGDQKQYNVFYIPDAQTSLLFAQQGEFVERFGIKSVIGYGGLLPSGRIFACLMFAKVLIPTQTAQLFKPFALNTKLAVLPFDGDPSVKET